MNNFIQNQPLSVEVSADVSRAVASELAVQIRSKSFNISKKLNDRRLKYGIPNGAFEVQALFDKIYVYQIPFTEQETYVKDGKIIMPETGAKREKETACRGVLVSAGLKAMDSLSSHGTEVGDIVKFMRLQPWRMQVDDIGGYKFYVMVMLDGDLVGNEDLSTKINTHEIEIEDTGISSADYRYVIGTSESKNKLNGTSSEGFIG